MTERSSQVLSNLIKLRRNDPNDTTLDLFIRLYSAQDITEMVDALNNNIHIQILRLDFDEMERRLVSMTPILSMIESRTKLKKVILTYSPLRTSSLVLGAIARNPAIQSVVLYTRTVVTVEALSEFLEQTKSVTELYVILGSIQESDDHPMEELEIAFGSNKSLENVTILGLDEEYVLIQVLRGLAAHCKLCQMSFGEDGVISWVALNAIRYCMEKSTTIERVEFF